MKGEQETILLGRIYEFRTAREEAITAVSNGSRQAVIHDLLEEYRRGDRRLSGMRVDYSDHAHVCEVVVATWASRLIAHGRRLDDQLDELLASIITRGFSWRSPTDPLEQDLKAILVRREDLRAYEREVEEYVAGAVEVSPDMNVLPATALLDQVQRTYDRCYDLCTFKLTTIETSRLGRASLLVAAVAVLISVTLAVWLR